MLSIRSRHETKKRRETGRFHQFVVASVVLDEEVAVADHHTHHPSCRQGGRDNDVRVLSNVSRNCYPQRVGRRRMERYGVGSATRTRVCSPRLPPELRKGIMVSTSGRVRERNGTVRMKLPKPSMTAAAAPIATAAKTTKKKQDSTSEN